MTTTQTTRPGATATGAGPEARRLAGWTGIAFAVTFVAGFLLVAQVPAYDAPDAAWVDWVENDNVQTTIGTLLLTASGLLLTAFVTSLSTVTRRTIAGDLDDAVVGVLRGAGAVAGTTLVVGALVGGAMPAGVTFAPDFGAPSAELIRSLDQLSVGLLLVGTGWSMALAIALVSWTARRSTALPSWLALAGLAVGALLVLSPLFLPFVLLIIWALVTGIVILRSSSRPAGEEPHAATAPAS